MTTRLRRQGLRPVIRVSSVFLCVVLLGPVLNAQQKSRIQGGASSLEHTHASPGFEENLGQVRTTEGAPAPFVRFRLSRPNTNIFLLSRGIAYQFDRLHEPAGYSALRGKHWRSAEEEATMERMRKEVRLETFRMDVELEGADPEALVTTEGRSADHNNYYFTDGSGTLRAAVDVHTYATVTYHDVYPHIDWSITATGTGIEHDFIVHPGGDPARIRLRYAHHEDLRVDDAGGLIHGNRLGRFTEAAPISYQGTWRIGTRMVLRDDVVSFSLDAYDKGRDLRIDPPRQWGTYYGGSASDWSISTDVDAAGNIYMAGWTNSTGGIATFGSQQHTYAGLDDGMLVKFGGDGVRLWGTYYGGSQDDAFAFCSVGASGVYASGISQSPGLATVHQTTWAGNWDALLVKFAQGNGQRIWSTYYGGAAEDRGRGCDVDPSGNVLLSGFTYSDEPGVIASNGSQNTRNGDKEGFLVKFDEDGDRTWGTYYGGSNVDEAFSCAVDDDGNIYLAGGTGSVPDTSIATGNAHQSVFGGAADAYLAKFSPAGARFWGTYYGGPQSDYGFACAVDPQGHPYLAGDTYSAAAIATSGVHQSALGGGCDAFLVKFDSNGGRIWGTYHGGINFESGRGCSIDAQGRIYLAGETESTSNIASNGFQMTYGGGEVDGYLAAFDGSGQRLFGTYYGGALRDEAYSAVADGLNNIYLVGRTLSSTAISTSGSHQPALNGPYDAFLVKFGEDPDCLGVAGGSTLPGTACDDSDPCTINDVYNVDCICAGTSNGIDADGDGVPDCADSCPNMPGQIGDPCDDGDPQTINDVVSSSCICSGAPASCTQASDCNDQNDCTYDECIDLMCVYTPISLGPIDGPEEVDAPGLHMFSIPPPIGVDLINWILPAGWSSPDTHSEFLEVEIGFVPAGEVELCVTGVTGSCEVDTCELVMVHTFIGLDEQTEHAPAIDVRPNPSPDAFIIDLPRALTGTPVFSLWDVSGRHVEAEVFIQGPSRWCIRPVNTPPGAYQLRIAVAGRQLNGRLLLSP